jgi:flagellar biosynthetic protein FliR
MLAEAARVDVIRLPWEQLLGGAALFVRLAACLAVAPVFGTAATPVPLRAGFAVLLTALLLPVVPPPDLAAGLSGLVVGEAFIGLLLGFSALMVIEVAAVAGEVIGYPTGLAAAQQLDPVTQGEAAVPAAFYRLTGLLVFLAIGGHRQLLAALGESYRIVPVGGVHLDGAWLPSVVALTGRTLALGLQMAAPVLVAGLLVDVFLMLVARAAPQLNLVAVGAPLRLAVGLLAIAFSLQMLAPLLGDAVDASLLDAGRSLEALAGRP